MAAYEFSILTPQGKIFAGEVLSTVVPGQFGEFGVLAEHAPMIAAVTLGVLKAETGDKTLFFAVQEGILEVSHNEAILLVDGADPVKDRDEALHRVAAIRGELARRSA